jgi:hypothetical protein
MKAQNFLKLFLVSLIISSFVFTSCKKDKDDINTDTDTNQASDFALAEKTFNDALDIADEAGTSGSVGLKGMESGLLSNCATVTFDTIAVPHLITVDFGTVNCLCNDGKYRRGQILISFTGQYMQAGHTHTITFNNYFVNDNQVTGTKTVINNGYNTSNHLTFTVTVDGQLILANNAGTISWESDRVREWTEGDSTPEKSDDVFMITGTSTVTRINGSTSTHTITTPLRIERGCMFRYPVSGVVLIERTNLPDRILDYSYMNSQCDKVATVTINGTSYNITLP